LRPRRYRYRESGATLVWRGNLDPATVGFRNRRDNGQTQTGAFGSSLAGFAPGEPFEDPLVILLGDAGTFILNPEQDISGFHFASDPDRCLRWRVFRCVTQKVHHGLIQAMPIA
jgi:hypothetical protein